MTEESQEEGARPLDQTRQMTIDALCEHFANDVMGVEEFERRVDLAHQASSNADLRALLRDLPGGELPAVVAPGGLPAASRGYQMTSADRVRERGFAVAVLGGTRRTGRWTPAHKNYAIAVCGGAELDFREAVLGPGVTELEVYAMWGGVEVIVPPGLNVESHGIGLLGGFDHRAESYDAPDPTAPTLRVTGIALMGGVEITVRHVGESKRDARRRRRVERRERAREIREGARDIRRRLRS
jgi:DUF1707 SHOCT-like domain